MNATNNEGSLLAAQAIASSIKTLLGASTSVKCCIGDDDDDAIICSDAAKILQYLEVQHPAGFVINDACQAMHKTYGCGCKTLVCMIGFWSRAAYAIQNEGVPVSIITRLFGEALSKCIQVLEEIAIPLQEVLQGSNQVCDCVGRWKPLCGMVNTRSSTSPTFVETNKQVIIDDNIGRNCEVSGDLALFGDSELLSNTNEATSGQTKLVSCCTEESVPNVTASSWKGLSIGSDVYDDEFSACRGGQPFGTSGTNTETTNYACASFNELTKAQEVNEMGTQRDEFDECFDDVIEFTPVRTAHEIPSNCCSSFPQNVKSNKEISAKAKKSNRVISSNKMELEKTDQMLKHLGISGSKMTSAFNAQVVQRSRNLSRNSPKTLLEIGNTQEKTDTGVSRVNSTFHSNLSLVRKAENLEALGKLLSHGKDTEMKLAVQVTSAQLSTGETRSLDRFVVDKNAINVVTIIGPTSNRSQVLDGISLRQTSKLAPHLPCTALRAVLINGDVTEDFRHTGFKDSFQARQFLDRTCYAKHSTKETQPWLQRCLKTLRTLHIGVVFAKGIIDKDVRDFCQATGVVTFSNVPSRTLQLLSTALASSLVIYFTDVDESDIGRSVVLRYWEISTQSSVETTRYVLVKVVHTTSLNPADKDSEVSEYDGLVQTALLCGLTKQLLMESELAFWNCVSRLQNCLCCGRVLPGTGKAELACIKKLEELSENASTQALQPTISSSWLEASLPLYRQTVFTAFADGLVEFLTSIMSNSGRVMSHGHALSAVHDILTTQRGVPRQAAFMCVADDFTSKINAWQRAVGVVQLLLQADIAVASGMYK